jgi:hypothetical protein
LLVLHSAAHAARFLGGCEEVACARVSKAGDAWAFDDPEAKFLVRFPVQSCGGGYRSDALATGPYGAYDEEHLRKLYVYVELTSSYEITERELQPGCAFSALRGAEWLCFVCKLCVCVKLGCSCEMHRDMSRRMLNAQPHEWPQVLSEACRAHALVPMTRFACAGAC